MNKRTKARREVVSHYWRVLSHIPAVAVEPTIRKMGVAGRGGMTARKLANEVQAMKSER